MGLDRHSSNWLEEFKTFLIVQDCSPPKALTQSILDRVRLDLNPPIRVVAPKVLTFHTLSTLLAIVFCPQLGVGPLIGGHGAMHVFMQFGALPCAALCGALFLGFSALVLTLALRREELRVAANHGFLNVTFLSAITFAALMVAGGNSPRLEYLFWLLGAIAGGWIVLRLGTSIRVRYSPGIKSVHLSNS